MCTSFEPSERPSFETLSIMFEENYKEELENIS